jgi:hypothetical protein
VPSDYFQVADKLFDGYRMELHEIFVLGPNLELENKSLAALPGLITGLDGQGAGVVFVLQGKAQSKRVEEAYQRIKSYCESAKCHDSDF